MARPLLPRRPRGATAQLLGIMLFVMTITAAAGLAVWNGNRLIAEAAEGQALVQLPGGAERTDDLADFLAEQPEVTRVQAIAPDDVTDILERWMGPAAREADLPLPALIELDFADDADLVSLRAAVSAEFEGARLVANERSLSPILDALRAVALIGLGLVLAIALAASVAIALAARAALEANRSTIATLHGMGASDAQVAQTFLSGIWRDALLGGALGTVGALLVLWLLSTGGGASLSFLVGGAQLIDLGDIALLLALPLVAVLMAFLVARATILRDLRRAL